MTFFSLNKTCVGHLNGWKFQDEIINTIDGLHSTFRSYGIHCYKCCFKVWVALKWDWTHSWKTDLSKSTLHNMLPPGSLTTSLNTNSRGAVCPFLLMGFPEATGKSLGSRVLN